MILRVVVAVVAAFLISGGWYAVFGSALARLSPAYADGGRTSPGVVVAELVRSAVVATVIAVGVRELDLDGFGPLVAAAVLAWVGFPVVLLAGSVLHERVPWRLAAIHAGDWLLKLIAVMLIVGLGLG